MTVAAAVGVFLALSLLPVVDDLMRLAVPTSRWMEVHALKAGAVGEGIPAGIRTISHPIDADWTVTIRRSVGDVSCIRQGRSDGRPGMVLPSAGYLGWLIVGAGGETCPELPPGRYVLTMVWTIGAAGLPRSVRGESYEFEVR